MKLSKLTAIIFTSALACSFTLTGCNEKTAKLEPNNWNCRDDHYVAIAKRLYQQEKEGKIKDASLFLKKCQQEKLGFFSDEYQAALYNSELIASIEAKWQKEAGINSNDY